MILCLQLARINLCLRYENVANTSRYREHLSYSLFFILILEATVLKVIRIFLYQPVDNDKLVILKHYRHSHYLQINSFD